MARVVCVHGVGQQLGGEESLLGSWRPALHDGLRRVGSHQLPYGEVAMAFYGDLFRLPGQPLAVGEPRYTADDVGEGFETELLLGWWEAVAEVDAAVVPPGADTLVRTPRSVQAALRALSRSRFFSGLALRGLVGALKQTSRYLQEPEVRSAARKRVLAALGDDTRVVVAHSLGSVVAYEALCSAPGHRVRALVTLGSPLGLRMIFDRLSPAPDPLGAWPGGDGLAWTNVVDHGDVVALVKDLRPCFGPRVDGVVVHNGAHAHDATVYLTDVATGAAIAGGLGVR